MRANWMVTQNQYVTDCDELILCNYEYTNVVIYYTWYGKSNKETLYCTVGKWKIKSLKNK